MTIMGDKSWDQWIEEYESGHQHPGNRLCHLIGIPMIVVSLIFVPMWLLGLMAFVWPLGLFILGWVFQFVGHALEGKPPEFFKDWRFLLVGTRWWMRAASGRE